CFSHFHGSWSQGVGGKLHSRSLPSRQLGLFTFRRRGQERQAPVPSRRDSRERRGKAPLRGCRPSPRNPPFRAGAPAPQSTALTRLHDARVTSLGPVALE